MFLLTNDGPFAILTMALGLVGLIVALWVDMSDPHRLTRRAQSGFWLHVIAAPAIVNTVALTLFEIGTLPAQASLIAFVAAMAIFAIVIDRRSFLVSAVGYIVALSMTVDGRSGAVLRPPNVASYGFMEMEESGELFERASEMAQATLAQQQERGLEWGRVRERVADAVSKFLYDETRHRPTVLAEIVEI